MISIDQVFEPIVGLPAWNVRRGHGSFITIEFGAPNLEVRQPREVSSDASESVRKNFKRRRVFVVGQWHFWIQYSDWTIRTETMSVNSNESDNSEIDECLAEIDGQILLKVSSVHNSCKLDFDLGGKIEIRPSANFQEEDDDLWSLTRFHQFTHSCRSNGVVVTSSN